MFDSVHSVHATTSPARGFCGLLAVLLVFSLLAACGGNKKEKVETLIREAGQAHDRAVLEKDPKKKEALFTRAEELLRQAGELLPEDAHVEELQVRLLWDEGKQLDAVRLSEALERSHPQNPHVWKLRAEIHTRLKQWDKALDAYRRAVKAGADEKELIISIGACLGRLHRYEDAFDAFNRAEELGVHRGVVAYNMGLCYEGSGNPDLALDSYLEAYEQLAPLAKEQRYTPVLVNVLLRLSTLSRTGTPNTPPDRAKALSWVEKAYTMAPNDLKVLAELADLLLDRKEYDRVYEIVLNALKVHPGESKLLQYKRYVERLMEEKNKRGSKDHEQEVPEKGKPGQEER